MHHTPLRGISSRATQHLLAALTDLFEVQSGQRVQIESLGGVDALGRVQAGVDVDLVFLASESIDRLMESGHLHAYSRVDLFKSPVAVAVPAGAPLPDIGSAPALRAALLAAPSIGFSTGPSGSYLMQLLQDWGLTEALKSRMVQTPPGVPVGSLVASGQVALGFQQASELLHLPGISVVGPLPAEVAYLTTFSAGLSATLDLRSKRADASGALLAFMRSDAATELQRLHGMQPA